MATVQELYQQILGREAEPSGLLYWQNQFGSQVDPAEVARFQVAAASELAQREAQAAAAPAPDRWSGALPNDGGGGGGGGGGAANIEALYQSQLGRPADPEGLAYWTNKFGSSVDANEAAQFQTAAARELAQRSSQQAVEALYQSQLGRASDPGGLSYWTNKFGGDIDANELAQFQAAAAKEIAGRTTGVRPPVTPIPVAPRPIVPGGVGNVVGGGGSVYPGGTSGVFLGGGSPGMTGVMPFSNVGQGLATNFANYQSIPIGSQYNPAVTAGGVSPYEQVMGQMRPLGNPYANVMSGQAMGGYNPALYDQAAAVDAARTAAANSGSSDYGSYTGTGGGMAKGGMVHGGLMSGPNPAGPDDGAVNLDIGEYVIKKSSVNKYGRGLLDMINEGKVPAKKMKSLLG